MQENPSICMVHVMGGFLNNYQESGSAAHTESPVFISRPFIKRADVVLRNPIRLPTFTKRAAGGVGTGEYTESCGQWCVSGH